MRKLTVKQSKFINEYVISGNATQSAIKAGYSKKTAGVIGDENLKKPYIREAIDKKLAELEEHKVASAVEVLQFLTRVMRDEETTRTVVDDIVEEIGSPIKERIRSAELIGKRYGLWVDKIKHDAGKEELSKLDELLSQMSEIADE